MPLPFAPLLNDLLVNLPSAAYAAGSSVVFSTNQVTYMALDINVTTFTGGTTPTVAFGVDRLGADGLWYNVWTSNAYGTAVTLTQDLGPGFTTASSPNGSQHAVFTTTGRFTWTYTGTPTSITFSASVIGR